MNTTLETVITDNCRSQCTQYDVNLVNLNKNWLYLLTFFTNSINHSFIVISISKILDRFYLVDLNNFLIFSYYEVKVNNFDTDTAINIELDTYMKFLVLKKWSFQQNNRICKIIVLSKKYYFFYLVLNSSNFR